MRQADDTSTPAPQCPFAKMLGGQPVDPTSGIFPPLLTQLGNWLFRVDEQSKALGLRRSEFSLHPSFRSVVRLISLNPDDLDVLPQHSDARAGWIPGVAGAVHGALRSFTETIGRTLDESALPDTLRQTIAQFDRVDAAYRKEADALLAPRLRSDQPLSDAEKKALQKQLATLSKKYRPEASSVILSITSQLQKLQAVPIKMGDVAASLPNHDKLHYRFSS